MTQRHEEDECNIVYTGVRKDGCFGYFETPEQLPEGWTAAHPRDISDVMQSLKMTKVETLMVMNAHWK